MNNNLLVDAMCGSENESWIENGAIAFEIPKCLASAWRDAWVVKDDEPRELAIVNARAFENANCSVVDFEQSTERMVFVTLKCE